VEAPPPWFTRGSTCTPSPGLSCWSRPAASTWMLFGPPGRPLAPGAAALAGPGRLRHPAHGRAPSAAGDRRGVRGAAGAPPSVPPGLQRLVGRPRHLAPSVAGCRSGRPRGTPESMAGNGVTGRLGAHQRAKRVRATTQTEPQGHRIRTSAETDTNPGALRLSRPTPAPPRRSLGHARAILPLHQVFLSGQFVGLG